MNQFQNDTSLGDIDSMIHLKRIAWISAIIQYWAAIIYLFCSLIIPESKDAAVSCGVMAIMIALTPAIYAFYQKRYLLVFSCISVFNIAPIWFLYLEAVLPGYDAYMYISPALRMEAFFWVAVFLIFINILYVFCWSQVSRFSIDTFSLLKSINFKPSFYQLATILCFLLPLIANYFYYKSFDIMWIALTAGRAGEDIVMESVGTLSGLMIPVNAVWQLTPLLGAITFVSAKNKLQPLVLLSLGLGITVSFVYFLSGSRGVMMFVIAPFLFFLFYYNWDRGLKFWIAITTILFILIGIMELQVRFRGNLLDVIANPTRAAQERGLASATTFDPTESHRDNNTYFLCLIIQGYPAKYPFPGLNDLFVTFVNPIPRSIWPDKPVMIGAKDISQQPAFALDGPVIMGTTSLSYSVVGEAYMAEGIIGLFIYAIVYGVFLLFFDGVTYYAHRDRPISVGILGLGVFLSFWGFRAFFALMSFSYPVILLIIFFKIIQKFKSNANYVYGS